jgi:beta-galactosidase
MSGGFVWTGFDYRGEPTPYGWPCINSHFGIMDMCGFPKDNFWFYQSWWTERPVLHLLPHWNWPEREGQQIDVRALSNCDEVELFVNGRSCGRQAMERDSELQWSVPYEPGVLSAKGYKAGQVVAETKVETTGAPAAVTLTPDRAEIAADGEDVAIVTVAVVDAQGRVVPDAGNTVDFALDGPGRIIGVGNGDPSCHEPDVMVGAAPAHTLPIDGWRWKANTDVAIYWPTYLPPDLPEEAVDLDDSSWDRIDGGAATPVKTAEKCVFRTRFNLSRADLDASVIELVFGRIAGGGYVYLNGRRVGETGSAAAASVYDVKAALREGENTLVLGIVSYGGMASLSKGVWLRLQENPAPVAWRRSVFNGYAQILVQAAKESGELQLTARAEGLAPATLRVKTLPAQLRPAVP